MIYNRKGIIGIFIILLCITIGVLVQDPIAQSLEYHDFADNRTFFSIPNFYNVLSNLPFIIVGVMGLYSLYISNELTKLEEVKVGYSCLFLGLLLIGFGSGYYHLWPSNQTLVWDRFPMTLAFMALTAIIIAEYLSVKLGKRLLYPLLITGGASVLYWHFTESIGAGDLRFYILVQFLPLIAIPLILLLMKPTFSHGNRYWWLLASYIIAKVFEHFDPFIFTVLTAISGHTLKHLTAALGMLLLLNGYNKRNKVAVND
ncbi:ceramidase domain-containing protein [Colwellia psychrerythraea]|uniref:Alkaline phytoceramidase n=1 Tax=Colwellia psychrerythraea TaxID=28229 RepID=A0A099KIG4_COLPS|nr:ceramidase domain-containing protein [Colwellia psychrerythraea]KGJ90136.1 Alkaline phytoceramidase [Colwellia psychrerythraea]